MSIENQESVNIDVKGLKRDYFKREDEFGERQPLTRDHLKFLPQYLLPKKLLSRMIGLHTDHHIPFATFMMIVLYVRLFHINMEEASQSKAKDYRKFNEFFSRHLKENARIIEKSRFVSPVDGTVTEFGDIHENHLFQAKQFAYPLSLLIHDDILAKKFDLQGLFVTQYLSPADYHRVHMPVDGEIQRMIYVPGEKFSVKPSIGHVVSGVFARNERMILFIKTKNLGLVVMVLVGAVVVGRMGLFGEKLPRSSEPYELSFEGRTFKKGDDVAHFLMGSTVITLIEKGNRLTLCNNIESGYHTKVGESLGERLSHKTMRSNHVY